VPERPTVRADFNERDRLGRLATLARFASAPLSVGITVRVTDGEGNECLGIVRAQQGSLIYIEPDWATWDPARDLPDPHPTGDPTAELLDLFVNYPSGYTVASAGLELVPA
jgi:hypothetical protein